VTAGEQDRVRVAEPAGPAATGSGPFSTRQLLRLDEAMRLADRSTGLTFSVYLGELKEPTRECALAMHRRMPESDRTVLIAVSPNQRVLEIVTGAEARKRIPDRDTRLAALSMVAAFGGGDLVGGLVSGLDQLATRAGRADRTAAARSG